MKWEMFLKKRVIFLILCAIVIVPTAIMAFFGHSYGWYIRGSIYSLITVFGGVLLGHYTTIQRIKQFLESEVDKHVNDFSMPRKEFDINSHDLEGESFEIFAKGVLKLFCERMHYDAGILQIFNKSLKPPFKATYQHPSGISISAKNADYKLYYDTCNNHQNDYITISRGYGEQYFLHFSSKPSRYREMETIKPDIYASTAKYPYIRLLPISLHNELLGYMALFRESAPTLLDKLVNISMTISEKSILQAIENKKIDDAVQSFLSRQLLLQVLITINKLDCVSSDLDQIESYNELAEKVTSAVRNCWRFNSCVIYHSDEEVVIDADSDVDEDFIRTRLIPRVSKKVSESVKKGEETFFYEDSASNIGDASAKPGFHKFFALKIQKEENYYGYIVVTADREFTDFEKQVIPILENYKIDDCYYDFSMKIRRIS